MPSRPADIALRDILHHIELAANFAAGCDRDSFKHDIKTVYAVTRCLEIILEASRRLPGRSESATSSHWLEANGGRGKRLSPRLRRRCGGVCMGNRDEGVATVAFGEAELRRGI
jgi:ribonuclease HepT-like protein